MGATLRRTGVNLAIFSKHATSCTLVLLQPGAERPFAEYLLDPHSNRTGQVWHAFVQGLDAGMQYGFRFDMQPNPNPNVHRFDPSHVLLDPYARVLSNGGAWGQYPPGNRPYRNSVVVEHDFDWGDDQPLNIPLVDSIIYEAHVRSFTQHPSSAVAHRGTYAGLIEKIPYLKQTGSDSGRASSRQRVRGKRHQSRQSFYRRASAEFLGVPAHSTFMRLTPPTHPTAPMANRCVSSSNWCSDLHKAGIEVILDMVFNHTAEGDETGPTWSFRGIDNSTYYILDPETGKYVDFTGCGNTVNCNNPVVRDFIVDCLRYWVMEMHVDGFRFDLASVLGRGRMGGC